MAGAITCSVWRLYDCVHPKGLIGRMLPGSTEALRAIRTDSMMGGLLLGSALALILASPSARAFVFRNSPKGTPLLLGLVLLVNLAHTHSLPTFTTFLLIALLLAYTLAAEEGIAHRLLNSRLLIWIGTVSYSLYVWQQVFLLHSGGDLPLGRLSIFPLNLVCVFVVAACSFYFIERPAIALGRWLYARKVYDPRPPADGAEMVTENA
jgi:peptidoglycan/LPS O-acetylase OafA/YrhL